MSKREIYIPIFYQSGIDPKLLKEVCAGLEEEGVPFQLSAQEKAKNFTELGAMAARMSPLEVGIGAGIQGKICIHHEKLPPEQPYFIDEEADGRKLGKNAARLVKGLPLQFE